MNQSTESVYSTLKYGKMDITIEKIHQLCRVCLSEDTLMFSVFHKSCMNLDISSMIMCCTTVKINAGDGMPELLCSNCLQKLEVAYSFKQECEQSEIKLRNLINENIEGLDYKTENAVKTEDNQSTEDYNSFIDCNKMVKVELNVDNEELKFETDENYENEERETRSKQYNLRQTRKTPKIKIKNLKKKFPKLIAEKMKQERQNYLCATCNKSFSRHQRYWLHLKKHPAFTCYVCFKKFVEMDKLEEHEKEHINNMYICDFDDCDLQFTDCRSFVMHKRDEHQIINFLHCSECDKSFNSHAKWDLHIQKHLRNQFYECNVCQKRFKQKCYVHTHMKIHMKQYQCDQCDKSYTSENKLQVHKFTHTENKPCECPDCGKKFVQKYNLDRHINVTHKGMKPPKREKRHLCPHCGQIFARPVDLTIHIRIHTGVKPYGCEQCEYRCHNKELLKSHLRTHTGLRPYKCSYCEKSFGTRSYLTIHERFHSGYRPYICSKCQKGFTNSKDLKVHERTHTGIKLFSCQVCHNSFTTLHYLRVHTKKHDTQ